MRRAGWRVGGVLVVVLAFLAGPSLASATDYTWSGAGNSQLWSNGTNWGGVAPSGSVGTLTFPDLSGVSACTSSPPTEACYQSFNDVSGITANALSITGGPYNLSGNGITLGTGGITAAAGSGALPFASLSTPLALSGPQTWSVSGESLSINGNVTGSSQALALQGTGGSFDDVSDIEVGPITAATGADVLLSGPGTPLLNWTDGNPVTFNSAWLEIYEPAKTGPISMTGSSHLTGSPDAAQTLTVNGGVSFSSGTVVDENILSSGTTAGTNYSQLTASGAVDLGGASFAVHGGSGACPTLNVGDVDTMIQTTGSVSGTFSGLPDGSVVSLVSCSGSAPTVRINYTAHTVTATVVTAGGGGGGSSYALSVAANGSGSGGITSSDGNINCGSTCSHVYPSGTSVTLTATPSAGSTFAGWSGGGCSGAGSCTVTMTQAQTVTATFNVTPTPIYELTISDGGSGSGAVTSSDGTINCGSDCSHNYTNGTLVTLTASAAPGSTFAGWLGAGCSGSGACVVSMTTGQAVAAIFNTVPPPPPAPPPAPGYSETAGGLAHTWTNYLNAGGTQGPSIQGGQTVAVACKIQGFRVADGNTWWYRIAASPWNGNYYVSADAFYNNGQTSGSLRGTPFVDNRVPDCAGGAPSAPPPPPQPAHTYPVMNAAGGVYWRSGPDWNTAVRITGDGFYPGTTVTVTCFRLGAGNVPGSANRMWEQARWYSGRGTGYGWINEHFIDDGVGINQHSPGAPACSGSGSGPIVEPPPSPTPGPPSTPPPSLFGSMGGPTTRRVSVINLAGVPQRDISAFETAAQHMINGDFHAAWGRSDIELGPEARLDC